MVHLADYRGARGSNAGDEFHELWALEQVLGLLSPNTQLHAVKVEGVRTGQSGADTREPFWDSVDCSLYFGGDTLETADAVEFVQLKYSGDPLRTWSIARLTTDFHKIKNNSVLRKLADDYRQARQRITPGGALKLRLVSNQDVTQAVIEAVAAARADDHSPAAAVAQDLDRISRATGLRGHELHGFLAALDLSECGTDSRFTHHERVIRAIAKIIEDNATELVAVLRQRVRELMLPERHRDTITLETVLSWFGLADRAGLFPCPAEISTASNPVARDATTGLLAAIMDGQNLICLHGPAGCGKTTVLNQLRDVLPEGSRTVLFDCYGAGRYRFSDDKRHLPEHAFLQIANDLAVSVGTPFFMPRSAQQPIEVRQLLKRIRDAATVIEDSHPAGLLVIVIDAADNAVTAADLISGSERCFVHELVGADLGSLPANVRLVISSRTARMFSLQLPRGTVTVECPAFSLDETTRYALALWPDATTAWIEQFHHLSNGIPRVQAYATANAAGDRTQALDALRPGGKGLKEVLRAQFDQACHKVGQGALFERLVGGLAALRPPIPVQVLADITDATPGIVIDVVYDLSPGLRIEEGQIFIADEDFEDFVKTEAKPILAGTRAAVADYFQREHLGNVYAAIHIADALLDAGRGAELLALIQHHPQLEVVSDPIVRREVHLRRLRLALSVCRSAGNTADMVKVVLISVEANKDETALRQVLESEIDLAVGFAPASLNRLVLTDRDSVEKQGSALAQDAARAARAGDLITARERLAMHEAWLKRRRELTNEEIERWTVSDDDIAARAEAIFEILGAEAVLRELKRWRPSTVPIRAALKLVPALIERGQIERLVETLKKKLIAPPWDLLVVVPLALAGKAPERSHLKRSLSRLRKSFVPQLGGWHHPGSGEGWEVRWYELLLTASELAVNLGVSRAVIGKTLRLLDVPPPTSATQATELDAKVRIWLLKRHLRRQPITVDLLLDVIDPPPKEKAQKRTRKAGVVSRDSRSDNLRSKIRALFPIYAGRLGLIERKDSMDRELALASTIPEVSSYDFDYDYWSKFLRVRVALSVMRLLVLPGSTPAALFERATAILHGRFNDPFGAELIPLLQHVALRRSEHGAVQQIATSKTNEIKRLPSAASEKVDACLRLSRLLLRISRADADALFSCAIDLAKEIDWEAMHQIEVLSALSIAGAGSVPDQRGTAADVFRFASVAAECLANQDHFPWADAAATLTRLSIPVALAGLATWADDGTVSLQQTLPPFLRQAAQNHSLALETLTALTILLERPEPAVVEAILRACRESAGKSRVQGELARDCLLHTRPADRLELGRLILSFMPDTDDLYSRDLSLLEQTVRFLEERATNDEKGSDGSDAASRRLQSDRWDVDIEMSGRRFTTPAEIRAVLDLGVSVKPFHSRELLIEMRAATALADRILFLDALAEVELSSAFESDRVDVIVDALKVWAGSPAVELWRSQRLPRVIARRFSSLARWLKQGDSSLQRLLSAAEIGATERLQVLAEGVETSGLDLGSRALFGIVELMVADLPSDEAGDVLNWYARRLSDRLPPDSVRSMSLDEVPLEATDAVGRFVFSLLSDIDTRIRWRAAHSLRRLARMGACDVLDAVIGNWARTDDPAFRDPGAPFYWLAARLWLAMALERISGETPHAISQHLSFLADVSTGTDLPHVVIREYAKRAALRLVKCGCGTLPELDRVRSANEPRIRRIRSKKPPRWGSDRRDTSGRRFHFDSVDTLPYWYSHVLDLFPKVGMNLVLDHAERWILDRWGAPENANWWDPEPRKARYDESRFGLWSHRHGSLPLIERYGTYLEWHAMCCTVGELLETHALTSSDGYFEGFEYWLGRFLPTDADIWLSDRREPTPLDLHLWVPDPRPDAKWLRTARGAEFIDEVAGRRKHADWVVVAASYSVQFPTRRPEVRVESALVSPNTAPALVRALQTVANPFDFRIPPEGDELEIDQPPYRLIGWLAEDESDMRFDEHDPLRHQVRRPKRTPGRAVGETLKLRRQPGGSRWWSERTAQISFCYETWCDCPERYEDNRPSTVQASSGWRLWALASDLQLFLEERDMDLICEVQVERRTHGEYSGPYDRQEAKRKTFDRILLCRRDGAIETSSRRVGSWTPPRRRTAA